MGKGVGVVVAVVVAIAVVVGGPLLAVGSVLLSILLETGGGAVMTGACTGVGTSVTVPVVDGLPGRVGTWKGEQVTNAATIVAVGAQRGVPLQGQVIAVMTAMGESSLRNITYGDDIHGVRNPDGSLTSSLGLFQQQMWWGTREQRLDPAYAAGKFYDGLVAVPGWASMQPSLAAHAVQRNADPWHYTRWWEPAAQLVAAISGQVGAADLLEISTATAPCGGGASVDGVGTGLSLTGWANPSVGRVTSRFGPRNTGISGASTYHLGIDIANGRCGDPVYSAAAGVVVSAGGTGGAGGNVIKVDHGEGVATLYKHLQSGTLLVAVGDQVEAGQQVASRGGDRSTDPAGAGASSGCHLHLEVRVNGEAIDPLPFFTARGVQPGQAVVTDQ
ncbi:M23 family metallopeptidase [uncultured Cellulomonas sp.]|uniref:M23 family metallopeptidase n=1 Tax=uncultured Cellulomonas sp. TaxID=189682 RepID=UPI00262B6F64|nr:M23 family metallopeptidase [uncultured Cellulomonas sp.]